MCIGEAAVEHFVKCQAIFCRKNDKDEKNR